MTTKRSIRLLLLLVIVAIALTGCGIQQNDDGTIETPTFFGIVPALRFGVTFLNDNLLAPIGVSSYGLSIILLTIIIRVLLYPLTKKQLDSMRKMQEIQPQIKALQEKYGKDREALTQKQMELYKESGVNPAGGCLPLLLQMPILFSFYYALIGLGPLLAERFLWIPDLSFPTYTGGLGWLQPLTPQHFLSPQVAPYLILPLIYILTQFLMQRMSQAANPMTESGSTNQLMTFMPLMFAYITLIVPSGLSLYWVTSNVLQIIQQGLTTGWDALLPGKAKAGGAEGGLGARLAGAVGATSQSESSTSKGVGTGNGSAPLTSQGPPPVSAGRRRKMRKKKR